MRNSNSLLTLCWALTACLLAACEGNNTETSSSTGTTDGAGGGTGGSGHGGDGGAGEAGGAGGAGGTGGGSSADVSGTAIDTYKTSNETVTLPVKASRWTAIEAIVEADGKWTSYPGALE